MTLSVLQGEQGAQRKELDKLITMLRQLRPDLIVLPNLLFAGLARPLKAALGKGIVCGLTGEDIFVDRLPEPCRAEVFTLIRERARDVAAFAALTGYYAEHATEHFGLPAERVHRITMGIRTADFAGAAAPPAEPFNVGYLARICADKGLHTLGEGVARLRSGGRRCRLHAAGYLGQADRPYLERVRASLRHSSNTDDALEYVGEVTRSEKVNFLGGLHVLALPTTYPESKGFPVLEALAAGVPVVLPNHGAFPELIAATGGGLLHEPGDTQALADTLARLMDDAELRRELADRGRTAVHALFTAERMATEAWELFERFV